MTNLSKAERIARHRSFLAANWELLAAFAWQHHQERGRGAVCVPEADFVHAATPRLATLRLTYIADGDDRLRELGGWPGEKEAGWVRTYDPDARIVVLIVREDDGTSGYLVGGPVRPSAAFARRKATES